MRGTRLAAFIAAFVVFGVEAPAQAGVRKDYEPSGLVSYRLYKVRDEFILSPFLDQKNRREKRPYTGDVLEIRVNIAKGQYAPGPVELWIGDILISKFSGPPYVKRIPICDEQTGDWPLEPDENVPSSGEGAPKLFLNDGGDYLIEAFFTLRDRVSGKEITGKNGAPTATFSMSKLAFTPQEAARQVQLAIENATKQLRDRYDKDKADWQRKVDALNEEKRLQQERYQAELKGAQEQVSKVEASKLTITAENDRLKEALKARDKARESVQALLDGKPLKGGDTITIVTGTKVHLEIQGAQTCHFILYGKDGKEVWTTESGKPFPTLPQGQYVLAVNGVDTAGMPIIPLRFSVQVNRKEVTK